MTNLDLDSLPHVTTADLSMPVTADYFLAHGASAEQAAQLAAGHNEKAGRSGSTAPISSVDASEAARLHELQGGRSSPSTAAVDPNLAQHLDAIYAPPASSADYQMPATEGKLTNEALVADRALLETLHAERMPKDIGNALLKDLTAARPRAKSAEGTAALSPWLGQMLARAQADPTLKSFTNGLSVDHLLAVLSPETVIALTAWVNFRAARR